MKRIFALILIAVMLLLALAGCGEAYTEESSADKSDTTSIEASERETTSQSEESSESEEYSQVDENSQKDDDLTHSGYAVEVKFLQYTWDGWGITGKTVGACDIAYNIIDALKDMKETGETEAKISDDVLSDDAIGQGGDYPVPRGTMWLECEGKIYRLSPDMTKISRVETHFGEGKVLEITEELKSDISNAWHYAPYDYYKATYKQGGEGISLNRVFSAYSAVEIAIKDIYIENSDDSNNKIILSIISNEDKELVIRLYSQQSDDNLATGEAKELWLEDGVSQDVELSFGGWKDTRYWVYIEADNTKIEITIEP